MTKTLRLQFTLACFVCVSALAAQGGSGAVVWGVAVDTLDRPVPGALVVLHHEASGTESQTSTDDLGRFRLAAQVANGSFTIVVRAVGHRPSTPLPLRLEAGDLVYRRLVVGFPSVQALPELQSQAAALSADGGSGYLIPGDGIRALPILSRDFVGLFSAIPQAVGRDLHSISGQHPGYNAILVDGATAADLYGVSRTPGSSAGAKAISLEALAGLRVGVTPFDVREGGFSGGSISAVTRSGGNQYEGSVFTSIQQPFLVGHDASGRPVDSFDKTQYGLTLSGPIRRDRLHFFVTLDLQRSATPFVGPEAGASGTGISDSTARRAAQVFRTTYGFDPGGPEPPVLQQPDRDLFAKLSWQVGPGSRLELSHNWVQAREESLNRTARNRPNRNGWQLSSSGNERRATVHATRLRGWTTGRRWRNEFLLSFETIGERRVAALTVPLFLVEADQSQTYLAGGSTVDAQGTTLDQQLLEVTNNATWVGGRHQVTLGGRLQLLHVIDNFFPNQWGVWRFPSVDALEQLAPDYYEVNLPLRAGGPVADFDVRVLAWYLQDEWNPSERLSVTMGLRFDVSFVDHPLTNSALKFADNLGSIDTGEFPSGHVVPAPRIGMRLDLSRSWRTVLRLGGGVFTGATPGSWMGGAFSNTGLDQQTLICTPNDGGVPAPITDPAQRPNRCLFGGGRPTPPSNVVAFSPAFRYPSAVKLLAGLDHSFTSDLSGSVDLILTHTRDAAYLSDRNLESDEFTTEGRQMYGAITGSGAALPARIDPRFGSVLYYENRSGDHSEAVVLSIRKTWWRGGFLQLGGQWSHAVDRLTVNRVSAALTIENAPIDGSMTERRRTRSGYDVPFSFTATGVLPLPGRMTASVLARYQSGRPYAYAVTNDANADGIVRNDLFYVPRGPDDISLVESSQYAELDGFIEEEACLRDQRGRIMVRNSCRNPAYYVLDARIAWATRILSRGLEISADIFNLPHLMNGRWGVIRETSRDEARVNLLSVSGWDGLANRPIYALDVANGQVMLPPRNQIDMDASRWRIQLGARLTF